MNLGTGVNLSKIVNVLSHDVSQKRVEKAARIAIGHSSADKIMILHGQSCRSCPDNLRTKMSYKTESHITGRKNLYKHIEVRLEDETIWLNLALVARLFRQTKQSD